MIIFSFWGVAMAGTIRPRRLIIAMAFYVAALALLALVAARRWVWLVIVAALLLVVASVVLNVALGEYRRASSGLLWRIALPALMLAAGLALLAFWYVGGRTGGVGFFGGSLMFLGIGQLLTEWRWLDPRSLLWGILIVGLCAVAFFVGLRGISRGASGWSVALLASGVLVSPVGLSLLSGGALRKLDHGAPPIRRTVLLFGGVAVAALAAGTFLLVGAAGVAGVHAVFIALALVLLVGAISSNTPADVLIVVAVLALVWAIAPGGVVPSTTILPTEGEPVMAALGDSFMSGEGARQFYIGTNRKGENECRRAPTAYAPLVVSRQDGTEFHRLAFVACSGATAVHIYERPQYRGEPVDGPRGLDQIDHLDWLIKDRNIDVELVLVSIGGNDALFGEIGRSCVGPGDCSELGARWLEHLAEVAPAIHLAYQRIRDYVGMDVPVVVVPYHVPISPTRCTRSSLTANEHRFLYGFTGELNKVLRRAAADAGFYYLGAMATALEDQQLRICDRRSGGAGVNFIGLNAVSGLPEQSLSPFNWFHNSLHPNERGHAAMADALEAWLNEHPNLAPRPEPSRDIGPPHIASIEELMGNPGFPHCGSPNSRLAHCTGSSTDWLLAQVATVLGRSVPALFLIVAGSWTLWLLVIWWWRRVVAPSRGSPRAGGRPMQQDAQYAGTAHR